jgi:predicted kinase
VLRAPLFSKDVLEAALMRSGITSEMGSGFASYEQLTALAEAQLQQGLSVVLDSVGTYRRIREEWRLLAQRTGAAFRVIECVVTDKAIHRSRMEGRERGIPGWAELTWDEVEAVRARYEPFANGDRLVVDGLRPLAENHVAIDEHLRAAIPTL